MMEQHIFLSNKNETQNFDGDAATTCSPFNILLLYPLRCPTTTAVVFYRSVNNQAKMEEYEVYSYGEASNEDKDDEAPSNLPTVKILDLGSSPGRTKIYEIPDDEAEMPAPIEPPQPARVNKDLSLVDNDSLFDESEMGDKISVASSMVIDMFDPSGAVPPPSQQKRSLHAESNGLVDEGDETSDGESIPPPPPPIGDKFERRSKTRRNGLILVALLFLLLSVALIATTVVIRSKRLSLEDGAELQESNFEETNPVDVGGDMVEEEPDQPAPAEDDGEATETDSSSMMEPSIPTEEDATSGNSENEPQPDLPVPSSPSAFPSDSPSSMPSSTPSNIPSTMVPADSSIETDVGANDNGGGGEVVVDECVEATSVDRLCYERFGDTIAVNFDLCGPIQDGDWVGIYYDGVDPLNLIEDYVAWYFACQTLTCSNTRVLFSVDASFVEGNYRAFYVSGSELGVPFPSTSYSAAFNIRRGC